MIARGGGRRRTGKKKLESGGGGAGVVRVVDTVKHNGVFREIGHFKLRSGKLSEQELELVQGGINSRGDGGKIASMKGAFEKGRELIEQAKIGDGESSSGDSGSDARSRTPSPAKKRKTHIRSKSNSNSSSSSSNDEGEGQGTIQFSKKRTPKKA